MLRLRLSSVRRMAGDETPFIRVTCSDLKRSFEEMESKRVEFRRVAYALCAAVFFRPYFVTRGAQRGRNKGEAVVDLV